TYMYVGRNSHAQTLTEHYDEGGVLNLSSPYSSPEFQDAIDELRATPVDNPEYQDVAQKAAEEGYKNGTTVPLYSEPVHFARTDEVSGNFQNREGFLNWTGVTIDYDNSYTSNNTKYWPIRNPSQGIATGRAIRSTAQKRSACRRSRHAFIL